MAHRFFAVGLIAVGQFAVGHFAVGTVCRGTFRRGTDCRRDTKKHPGTGYKMSHGDISGQVGIYTCMRRYDR